MSELGTDGGGDEQERQRVLRHLRYDSPEEYLPQVGMKVAGYRLETRLGTGGQGTVFRARREGRLFAVKFIFLPRTAHWAWRELDVMVKLWRAGGLPLEGHGLWPARQPLFLFLVTPFVRGLPLDVWVRVHNPNALEVADLVRQAARLLQVVHAAGVVHRDVKGANLLVCRESGRLVLVDFGVATYEGAPVVTGAWPPGTWPYLSPRVWRAWRGEEQSRASPGDDVWALGVEFYQMLTGRLPFQGREGALVRAILHEEPEVPHEFNPRVPRVLGEVCQRMLRKQPGERYADAGEVEVAVGEVLKQADATWEVPLCEAWGPHHATTVRQRDMWDGGDLLRLFARLASYERRPVRGKPRPLHEVSTLASPREEPPEPEALEAPLTCEEAPGEVVPHAPPQEARDADEARTDTPPPSPAVEPALPPVPLVDEAQASPAAHVETTQPPCPEPATEAEPPPARGPDAPATRSRILWAAGALLVLGLGVWLAVRPPPRASVTTIPPIGIPRATSPSEFYPVTLEPGGQEVAPPWKRPEGDGGAAPRAAATPAPVARATPPKDTRVKTPAKAPAPPQQKPQPKETSSSASTVGAVALTCTLSAGCPGPTTTPQVRPTPPQEAECPPGSAQAMKELGLLRIGDSGRVDFPDAGKYTTVRPGPVTLPLSGLDWGKLPYGTLFSGELLFGERVQGRFTQAHTPDGHTYAVCLELRSGAEWGWEKLAGSGQDTAKILSGGFLEPVKRFGEAWRYEDREKR